MSAPDASTVVSKVHPVPHPPVVDTPVALVNPPVPVTNDQRFNVATPPALAFVIVKVSPIK